MFSFQQSICAQNHRCVFAVVCFKQPRSGKGAQTDSGTSTRHAYRRTWDSIVENGQQARWIQRWSCSLRRRANCRIWLMTQSLTTSQGWASLLSKVRPPSTKTLQPIKSQPRPWQWNTHTPVCHYRVPGEIKSREVELDPQPRRDHEQGGAAGHLKLDFFRFRLFLNSGATDIVLVTLPKHGSWNSNCAVHKSLGNGEGTPP